MNPQSAGLRSHGIFSNSLNANDSRFRGGLQNEEIISGNQLHSLLRFVSSKRKTKTPSGTEGCECGGSSNFQCATWQDSPIFWRACGCIGWPTNINLPDDIIVSETQYTRASSTDTIANQNTYKVSVRIPGDAPSGEWEAFFSFAVPNGSYSPLRHARQIFKVQRQDFSGVPVNATIGID
jgi:hypothetical protein